MLRFLSFNYTFREFVTSLVYTRPMRFVRSKAVNVKNTCLGNGYVKPKIIALLVFR